MRNLVVNRKFDNKNLASFLMNEFPCLTQNTFYKALRKKDIRVNDLKVSQNVTIHEGDNIKVYILDSYLFGDQTLNIVYEDENILIVNKKKNMEVTRR